MKRMLVPFDDAKPGKKINDFIYPVVLESEVSFVGIKKTKKWHKGMVVYTGVDVSANDVFARIVDSGNKIDDVDRMIQNLRSFMTQLGEFKIGNILQIESDNSGGFRLIKSDDTINLMGTSNIP